MRVRLLGEDLIAFRDTNGRVGLVEQHCPHRGASLFFGRNEACGLRCVYHGWKFDVSGACVDMPSEPAESNFRNKVHATAYPTRERNGIIWAYMGPPERQPPFPEFEWTGLPSSHRYVAKFRLECNYLQASEGSYDLAHLNFLHYFQGLDEVQNGVRSLEPLRHDGLVPRVLACPVAITPYGLWSGKIRGGADFDGEIHTNVEFVLPSLSAFANGRVADARDQPGYTVNWHVPIDDEHHWRYLLLFSRIGPLGPDAMVEPGIMVDYHLTRNKSNRYLQDREEQRLDTYAGMGPIFVVQDAYATETAGEIQDRTQEHLAASDAALAAARRLMLRAIKDVQEGRDPPHVIRSAEEQERLLEMNVTSEEVPSGTTWEQYQERRRVTFATAGVDE